MYLPDGPLTGDLVVVRPATEADADLLVGWHAEPDVAAQWGNETYTHEEMLARLRRRSVDPYVIEEGGRPVGYIQAWFDDDISRAGLDMFLIGRARGRGLGPDAARSVVRWLFLQPAIRRVIVDVYVSNLPAVKAWQKAGFRIVSQEAPDDDNSEPWYLMAIERGRSAP